MTDTAFIIVVDGAAAALTGRRTADQAHQVIVGEEFAIEGQAAFARPLPHSLSQYRSPESKRLRIFQQAGLLCSLRGVLLSIQIPSAGTQPLPIRSLPLPLVRSKTIPTDGGKTVLALLVWREKLSRFRLSLEALRALFHCAILSRLADAWGNEVESDLSLKAARLTA
ncbi:MAG TPA: hypothetical protein VK421_06220 [Pyrinomonadaceae bacterium]|nr:hypothetical protein [Pyrinomonadaceae bacterium]